MPIALILALQAATPIPPDFDLARVRPIDFDLWALRGPDCPPGEDNAIVVCGRRPTAAGYPLERMERLFAVRPIMAETRLSGDVRIRAFVEQVEVIPGQVSNRVMIGIRTPF